MGQETKKKTNRIWRALLALGIFEKEVQPISKADLINRLQTIGVSEHSQASRLIETIQPWLNFDNQTLLNENNDNHITEYSIDFESIPHDIYLDFLDTFLSIHDIGNRPVDDSITELYNKEGSPPLSILSDLVLAIEEKKRVTIHYYSVNHRRTQMDFKPTKIFKRDNKWFVEGKSIFVDLPGTPSIEISKILSIS